jgi:hypothetical protein
LGAGCLHIEEKISILDGLRGFAPLLGLKPRSPKTSIDGAGSLTMLKCGACRQVYYCSVDCQKAARSKHKVVCLPKRNMDDVMGLSVGSFAEDEACSWVKSTVRQWRDDHAGVLELLRSSPSGWRQRTLESTARRARGVLCTLTALVSLCTATRDNETRAADQNDPLCPRSSIRRWCRAARGAAGAG